LLPTEKYGDKKHLEKQNFKRKLQAIDINLFVPGQQQ